MAKYVAPVVQGFAGSLVLALALIEAVFGGAFRVLKRIVMAFAEHKPLPVAPNRSRPVI